MNAVLMILALALFFYFVHRMHGQVGGCGSHQDHNPATGRPAESSPHGAAHAGPRLGAAVLILLLLLVPLMLLHAVTAAGSAMHPLLFWVALLLPIFIFPFFLPAGAQSRPDDLAAKLEAEQTDREPEWRKERLQIVGPLSERVTGEMEIEGTRYEQDLVIFEGRLRGDAETAYERLRRSFAELNRSPRLLEGERGRVVVVGVPMSHVDTRPVPQRLGVPLLLFAATLITTTWAGALHQGVNLLREPARFAVGLRYALALMAILLVHELGHYVVARRHGIKVTLPYFIPVPMGLGTFGAFIQIRGAIPDRRKLFDVGVAGPLAGLVIALPALYIGLAGAVTVPPGSGAGVSLSGSVLLAWLYGLANGSPIQPDHVVSLGPVGFAGWLGVLVTALNLIPVGQLDGARRLCAIRAPEGGDGRMGRVLPARRARALLLVRLADVGDPDFLPWRDQARAGTQRAA